MIFLYKQTNTIMKTELLDYLDNIEYYSKPFRGQQEETNIELEKEIKENLDKMIQEYFKASQEKK